MSAAAGAITWLQPWRWPWEPQVATGVAVLAWLYGLGVTRMAGTMTASLRLRITSFCLALAILVLALQSPLDTLADDSFAWHMTQHMLLLLVVPPLAMAGSPWWFLRAGLPGRRLRYGPLPPYWQWSRLSGRWAPLRWLAHPLAPLAAFACYLWVTHLPTVFDLTLRQPLVHDSEHLGYLMVGLWLWSRLIESPPLPPPPHYRWRIVLIAGGIIACWVLGIALTMASAHLYAPYLHVPAATPASVRTSLQIGGAIMWAPSMIPFDVVLTITIRRWLAHSMHASSLPENGAAGIGSHDPR
jgi:putative membrane protein